MSTTNKQALERKVTSQNQLTSSVSLKKSAEGDDNTPVHKNSEIKTDQLTSFSKKKSFEVNDDHQESHNEQEDMINLGQQILSSIHQRDTFNYEETKSVKSRKSENQSMRGVSFQTSDTEDNKSGFEVQSQKNKPRKKKRLSKVDEELKQQINQSKQEYFSESQQKGVDDQKSIASSKKQSSKKQVSNKETSKATSKKKRNTTDGTSVSLHKQRKDKDKTHDESLTSQQKLTNTQLEMLTAMQQNPWMQMMMLMNMPQNPALAMQMPQMLNNMRNFNPMALMMGAAPQNQQQQLQQTQMNPLMSPMSQFNSLPQQQQPIAQNQNQNDSNQQEQTQQQITQMINQLKETGQLPVQYLEIINQTESIKSQIEQITSENQLIQKQIETQQQISRQIVEKNLEQREQRVSNMNSMRQSQLEIKEQHSEQIKSNIDHLDKPNLLESETEQEVKIQIEQQIEQQSAQTQPKQEESKEINEQDEALKEIALIAATGQDPTIELEKENSELQYLIDDMNKRIKEQMQKVAFLEYENEILYGKSNSMDHSIQNYGKRLEELSKQIDELNAILRIKDQDMIEMTNEIHVLKMHRESMKKEIIFRKQREEQMEINLRKLQIDLDKAVMVQDELNRQIDGDSRESQDLKEENRRLKQLIERMRSDNVDEQDQYDNLKQQMNVLTQKLSEIEGKNFQCKSLIDRLRNESEQIKVDLTYSKATVENQREAYDKLNNHYQRQVAINQQLDGERSSLLTGQGKFSQRPSLAQYPDIMENDLRMLTERKDLFESARGRNDIHQRSSSQDNKRITDSRTFDRQQSNKFEKKQVKKACIDLSGTDQSTSITGQKRRGGVGGSSQTRDFVNRNYVSQMQNILSWQEEYDDEQPNKSYKLNQSRHQESFNLGAKTVNLNLSVQQGINDDSLAIPNRYSEFDIKKIDSLQDQLTKFQQKRQKINLDLNKVAEKTVSKENKQKKIHLEKELRETNSSIQQIKQQLKQLDALN